MSYTYLQEQGEESLAECFSAIPASVLSKLNLTAERSYSKGNGMESCQNSQSGMMYEHSTESRGEEKPTSSAVDSRAKTSVSPGVGLAESMGQEADCGERWPEWFAKLDRTTSSWRIRQLWLFADLDKSLETWPKWGTMLDGECWELETPEGCMNEIASRLLHLPTLGKNEFKGSARRRFRGSKDFHGAKMLEGLRTCEQDQMYIRPDFAEIMMNFPTGWTELRPLETHKIQQWLNLHGKH